MVEDGNGTFFGGNISKRRTKAAGERNAPWLDEAGWWLTLACGGVLD
jgi:hypothetical protein